MEFFMQLFPGIGTFFAVEPVIAVARIVLIVFGFVLACLGFKRTLEPLIMVPMGIGMMAVNCGMMFLTSGTVGNLLLDPLVSDASAIVDAMQVNFLQPIYNLTFSNGLILDVHFLCSVQQTGICRIFTSLLPAPSGRLHKGRTES